MNHSIPTPFLRISLIMSLVLATPTPAHAVFIPTGDDIASVVRFLWYYAPTAQTLRDTGKSLAMSSLLNKVSAVKPKEDPLDPAVVQRQNLCKGVQAILLYNIITKTT